MPPVDMKQRSESRVSVNLSSGDGQGAIGFRRESPQGQRAPCCLTGSAFRVNMKSLRLGV